MNDFAHAVATLQGYAHRAESRNYILAERYEEALNDLVRNPGRVGNPAELVDAALTNARQKLAHRGRAMPRPATPTLAALEPLGVLGVVAEVAPEESPSWPDALKPRTRRLLGLTALGYKPRDIAALENIAPATVWVALSRARAEARLLVELAA